MSTETTQLTREKETMLIALHSRAMESRSAHPLLRDTMAEEAIGRIDYDFARTRPSRIESLQVILRSLQLDRWTNEFLHGYADATVLQLGCGLDSRV
jgi:O-methyltransferase involved in polyketide biosynthesis